MADVPVIVWPTRYLYNPSKSTPMELPLVQSWTDINLQEQWALSADELALLPGMTNTGRLAFAVQLKFIEIHGRFPERHDEIDPAVLDWLASSRCVIDSKSIKAYRVLAPVGLPAGRGRPPPLGSPPQKQRDRLRELASMLSALPRRLTPSCPSLSTLWPSSNNPYLDN